MIAYRAMADVPRELVRYLGRLLYTERRTRGIQAGTRAHLLPSGPAGTGLVPQGEDVTLLNAGFGISRATAYRYGRL